MQFLSIRCIVKTGQHYSQHEGLGERNTLVALRRQNVQTKNFINRVQFSKIKQVKALTKDNGFT